jgi:hypothetical protein
MPRRTTSVQAEQDGGMAQVRCGVVTGDCEAATPLTNGTVDSGSPAYLLPAVR